MSYVCDKLFNYGNMKIEVKVLVYTFGEVEMIFG